MFPVREIINQKLLLRKLYFPIRNVLDFLARVLRKLPERETYDVPSVIAGGPLAGVQRFSGRPSALRAITRRPQASGAVSANAK